MTFFSQIDATNTRRFQAVDAGLPVVLAVYDRSRSVTLFAEVGADETGRACFVSEPRSYWPDEVEEVR